MSANTGRRICYGAAIVAAAIWWPFAFMGAVVVLLDYLLEG